MASATEATRRAARAVPQEIAGHPRGSRDGVARSAAGPRPRWSGYHQAVELFGVQGCESLVTKQARKARREPDAVG